MLNKAEVPRGSVFHHFLEQLQTVVEREAHEAYLALRLQPLHLLYKPVRQHIVIPRAVHYHVDVVEVDDIRADSTARLIEELLEVVCRLHLPPRHLGRDIYPVAPASGEGFANCLLTLSTEIDTARVYIVHASLDGTAHHRSGLVKVHVSVLHRQAQHPKTQRRHINSRAPHRTVLHLRVIIQNIFGKLFSHRLLFSLLRYGFRTAHGSYSCCNKSAFDKITSVHTFINKQ
ncbi:unknown [Prevotella sp. CAG:487]|nr:unknown [Prevotella sp. CAG:487]